MEKDKPDAVAIPYTELSSQALRGVIESFVLREGTEYGERDHSLDEKVAAVIAQLERGEARIMYEPESSTVELIVVQRLGSRSITPLS
jgi:uncharacterized protein YheU (UPF0270 family)